MMRSLLRTEDAWAVLTGVLVVLLGLGPLFGANLLGWVPKPAEWVDLAKAVSPAAKGVLIPGWLSVLLLYAALLGFLTLGARRMGHSPRRFAVGFTVLFAVGYACWVLGHFGYVAGTPNKLSDLGIPWGLGLTGEAGYLLALALGLLVGNLFPRFADHLRESARTEWYIKTAIVIVGGVYGLKAASDVKLTQTILLRGLAAIAEAYLIYWAVVYLLARKVFGFSREWAAPLASGISICGVSAAITTGAAVRARPVVPVMVSSLVVLFSVVELVVLPLAARTFLKDEPMVAAAWMGLAVKTDGAAISSGAITESYFASDAAERGEPFAPGVMGTTTTTIKVFIDLFIGVWAVVLGAVWAYFIDRRPGQGVPLAAIWGRFPKFVFGYVLTFAGMMLLGNLLTDPAMKKAAADGMEQADQLRRVFFVLTFFAIGLGANLRRLWAEGLGKLAAVYAVSLFGFVIWFGLLVSWLFFRGVKPTT